MLKALLTCRHWYKVPAYTHSPNNMPTLIRLRRSFDWEILTDASWQGTEMHPVKHRVIGLSLDRVMENDSLNIFYSYSILTQEITFFLVKYSHGHCYSWPIKTVNVGGSIAVRIEWDCELKLHKVYVDSQYIHSLRMAESYRWGWRLTPYRFKKSIKMWEIKINKKLFS